ncbi:hypothetical protein KR084_009180, partial [Drosophila pseudotakahashii]
MAPVPKRQRENNNTYTNAEMKRPRSSDAPAANLSLDILTTLNQRFEEQGKLISANMQEAEQRLLAMLSERLDGMTSEVSRLSERVQQMETEITALRSIRERVQQLESEVTTLRSIQERVQMMEAGVEARRNAENACDLRIHGVPFVNGERLKSFFNTLCLSINLTPAPRVRNIFRARKSQYTNVDPVVIVK